MPRYNLPKFKKGEKLSAAELNAIVDHLVRNTLQPPSPGATNGLEFSQDASGTRLAVLFPPMGILMFTSGGITARSGGTPGTGSAKYQQYTPSGGIVDAGLQATTVLNWSATAIGSGKYLWVAEDLNGYLWAVSAEC